MRQNDKQSSPLISIVIPARNEERVIAKCLDSLLQLNYPDYEIIIINDGSTDNTGAILQRYPVRVIKTHGVGPSKARNIGVRLAQGEFIAFTDADCQVHPEWLNELLSGFTSDDVSGVGGDQQSPPDETAFGRKVQNFMKSVGFVIDYVKADQGVIETEHSPTCNVMYRRAVLNEMGGFLEGLWPGEDLELDYRIRHAGYRLMYNPRAIVYHYRPSSLKAYYQMMVNYGRAQAFLVRKYGPFRKIHYELPGLILFLLILVPVTIRKPEIGFTISFLAVLVPLLHFFLKRKRLAQVFENYLLLVVTLIAWNYGFIREMLNV